MCIFIYVHISIAQGYKQVLKEVKARAGVVKINSLMIHIHKSFYPIKKQIFFFFFFLETERLFLLNVTFGSLLMRSNSDFVINPRKFNRRSESLKPVYKVYMSNI